MKLDREDFEQWRANPVTEIVLAVFAKLGEQAKQKWIEESWGKGNVDPLVLADLRARSEVIEDFHDLKYEDMEEWLEK